MKKAIIFGCTGQDGSYLSELLLKKNYQVIGINRRSSVNNLERLRGVLDNVNFTLKDGDLTDPTGIFKLVSEHQVDEIYNLAAMSHVGVSFDQPVTTMEINAMGPLFILEAINQSSKHTRFYQASTSELFGNSTKTPQNEDTILCPASPYGISKLAAHKTVGLYRECYGVFACAGILFNHESERRGENFVTRKITKYVAKVIQFKNQHGRYPDPEKNEINYLEMGNLNSSRDWSHAKDMVNGMWMMLQQDNPQDFVLASGKAHTIRQFLQFAFQQTGLDYLKYVVVSKKYYRPLDVNYLLGDCSSAKAILGWKPEISLQKMISDMIENDLNLLGVHILDTKEEAIDNDSSNA